MSATERLNAEDAINESLYQAKGIAAIAAVAVGIGEGYTDEELNGALWAVQRLVERTAKLYEAECSSAAANG